MEVIWDFSVCKSDVIT